MSAWLDAAGLARRISVNSEPTAAADAQVWSIVELWDVLPGERAVPGAVTLGPATRNRWDLKRGSVKRRD